MHPYLSFIDSSAYATCACNLALRAKRTMKVPACALAPVEGALAAKARIPTEHDAHVGPLRSQPPYQQSEDGRCMLHPVDVAGPQVGAQQLLAAEHVPRKLAVAVVVTVNDVALLLTMQRVGGAVEVQHQLLRSWQ